MAFALHVNMDRYPGHNNRVVVCPVDALEFFTVDPAKTSEIAIARHGESAVLDSEQDCVPSAASAWKSTRTMRYVRRTVEQRPVRPMYERTITGDS